MLKKIKGYFNENTISYTIALCAGVVLFIALSNIDVVKAVWDKIISVISPFIYAFALAFVLNRPMMWFERKVFTDSKRKKLLSIISVYTIFISLSASLFTALLPQLGQSISYIIESIPGFLLRVTEIANEIIINFNWNEELIAEINRVWAMFVSSVTEFSFAAIPGVLTFSFSLGSALIKMVMVLIISVYMLDGKEKLLFQIKKATYAYMGVEAADWLVYVANLSNRIFSGFIIGKLIDSTIIGILAFIGMMFIYPPYTVLIAVVIGVTNMIPFFGPFIGAIPCIFILLMISPMTAFIFTIFVFVLQQLDGNIIGPKILGNSLGLSPIWVLAGILVGNGLFGVVGMLIGVPMFAVLYTLVSDNIKKILNEKGISADYENNTIEITKDRS